MSLIDYRDLYSMQIKSALLALAAAGMLSGCVSMGSNYDPTAVTALRPGMTLAEVEKILGKPTSVVTLADGSSQETWLHSTGSMLGGSARSATLEFAADGTFVKSLNQVQTNIR